MTSQTTSRPRWPNPTGEQILAFEYEHLLRPGVPGRKRDAIRDAFGLSEIRYYQLLRAVALSEEAFADPVTTRLVRERMERWRRRGRAQPPATSNTKASSGSHS